MLSPVLRHNRFSLNVNSSENADFFPEGRIPDKNYIGNGVIQTRKLRERESGADFNICPKMPRAASPAILELYHALRYSNVILIFSFYANGSDATR